MIIAKLDKYRELNQNVKHTRRLVLDAREKITSYQEEYVLDQKESTQIKSCINKFAKVVNKTTGLNAADEMRVVCQHFKDGEACQFENCPCQGDNLQYAIAMGAFDTARKEHVCGKSK